MKLYDYQVGEKYNSAFRGPREAIVENLVETILPFRMFDLRQTPRPNRTDARGLGVDPRPFYGMEYLLLNSHADEREESEPDGDDDTEADDAFQSGTELAVGETEDPTLGRVSVRAIVLRERLPTWLKKSRNRVFHAVNGQVQFKETRGFLASCKLPALMDRVVIIVDASDLHFAAHNEVWKGDREHISNTLDGERYRTLVTQVISESYDLRQLQQRVAEEELQRASTVEANNLFQKVLDADPTLAGLLNNRDPKLRFNGGVEPERGVGPGQWVGLYSPTYVRLEDRYASGLIEFPHDSRRAVSAVTDVENGYLQRVENQGEVIVQGTLATRFSVQHSITNGRLVAYFTPVPPIAEVGARFSLRFGLYDDAMPEPVWTEWTDIVVGPAEADRRKPAKSKGARDRTAPVEGQAGSSGDASDASLGLPPCILLVNREIDEVLGYPAECWPEGFTAQDGGIVEDLGDANLIYKINFDNVYHLDYRRKKRTDTARDALSQKYILGMRILMLGFERAWRRALDQGEDRDIEFAEFAEQFRRYSAQGAASTILSIAEVLPRIVDASDARAAELADAE